MSDDREYFDRFNFEPLSGDSVCIYLYLLATLVAGWQWCERGRLAVRCEQQLRPITNRSCVKRPLLQFARLLTLSFALRAVWFLLKEAEVLAPACTPVNTTNDCANVIEDAFSRGSQFVFFTAFSLIVTFWAQWSVGFEADSADSEPRSHDLIHESSSAGHSSSSARAATRTTIRAQPCTLCGLCKGRKRASRCNAGFMVLCVWMFLLQCAAVTLKLVHTADGGSAPLSRFMFRSYSVMLSTTYVVLTLGMGIGGWWLHWRLKAQIADHEQWHARNTFQSGRPRQLPNPAAAHHHYHHPHREFGHVGRPHTESRATVASGRQAGVLATERQHLKPRQRPSGVPPRTADLLRRALCRLGVMQAVCVSLFLMRALLFSFSPLFSIDVSDDGLVFPWLWYPVPELVPGLLLLGATAPDPRQCLCCRRQKRPARRVSGCRGCCGMMVASSPDGGENTRLVGGQAPALQAQTWDDAASDTSDETVNSLASRATAPLGTSDIDALRLACRVDADRELRVEPTGDRGSEGDRSFHDDRWYPYAPPSPTWTVNSARSVHV